MPLLLLGASIWSAHPAAQDPSQEYLLKAAFVSKFPEFAECPEPAALDASAQTSTHDMI